MLNPLSLNFSSPVLEGSICFGIKGSLIKVFPINELKPILGLELTATPIDEKGNQFRNVVYEYSLAQALTDGLYVKNPTIATRKDFNSQGR
ncbi:MAG: hypothetical protein H0U39_03065, partial [Segetibacter sp.]|nr:hypothetical protein [Segetibacter sp.]